MRALFLLPVLFLSSVAFADPTFLDIARGADGQVIEMNKAEAIQYCKSQGAHLPSVRELALLTMSLGAKGLMSECGSDNRCYQINAMNADGRWDSFYFSYTGYQRPEGDLGTHWLWSSSVSSEYPSFAFDLQNRFGILTGHSVDRDAVRCVVGP